MPWCQILSGFDGQNLQFSKHIFYTFLCMFYKVTDMTCDISSILIQKAQFLGITYEFQKFACLFLLCSILSINKGERWGGGKGGGGILGNTNILLYSK